MVEWDEDWEDWNPSKGSFLVHMVAGAAAGVAEHVGMFPLDTYKVSTLTASGRGAPRPTPTKFRLSPEWWPFERNRVAHAK